MKSSRIYQNRKEVRWEMEKIIELVEEVTCIVILLENDLYIQKQDTTTINVVKVIHRLLTELHTEINKNGSN